MEGRGRLLTGVELLLGDRLVDNAGLLAAQWRVRHAALAKMRGERASAAVSFSNSKEETFKGSNKQPLFATVRTRAAVHERQDGDLLLAALQRHRQRPDGHGGGRHACRGKKTGELLEAFAF